MKINHRIQAKIPNPRKVKKLVLKRRERISKNKKVKKKLKEEKIKRN